MIPCLLGAQAVARTHAQLGPMRFFGAPLWRRNNSVLDPIEFA
ncbi:hypothetical protein AMD24_00338 [Candidatus Xiphinematobacter sp. Idaho Grape]|nr:hypothetical protein AMD24_00338 [Candidatus Xiphinematobacter sp. Idaho Grape]